MCILLVVILILVGLSMLIAGIMSLRENAEEEKYRISAEENKKVNAMMQTIFFKKLEKEIREYNIDGVILFTDITVNSDKIYSYDFDGYHSTITFKDLGYKDLTEQECRILKIALGKMKGYSYTYDSKGCYVKWDYNYWRPLIEKQKASKQVHLKNIY